GAIPAAGTALGQNFFMPVTTGPTRWWDVVGALNWKQAWGDIALRGALHQISIASTLPNIDNATNPPFCAQTTATGVLGCTMPFGSVVTSTGWAAQAGATFLLPTLGAGDKISFEAAYGNGAADYVGLNQIGIGGVSATWVGGLMYDVHDAIAIPTGDGTFTIEKEKAWSATVQYTHYWNPLLRTNLFYNYASVTPGTVTQNTDWTQGGLGKANQHSFVINGFWNLTKNAEIGLEAIYKKANITLPGNGAAAPTPLPAGVS